MLARQPIRQHGAGFTRRVWKQRARCSSSLIESRKVVFLSAAVTSGGQQAGSQTPVAMVSANAAWAPIGRCPPLPESCRLRKPPGRNGGGLGGRRLVLIANRSLQVGVPDRQVGVGPHRDRSLARIEAKKLGRI